MGFSPRSCHDRSALMLYVAKRSYSSIKISISVMCVTKSYMQLPKHLSLTATFYAPARSILAYRHFSHRLSEQQEEQVSRKQLTPKSAQQDEGRLVTIWNPKGLVKLRAEWYYSYSLSLEWWILGFPSWQYPALHWRLMSTKRFGNDLIEGKFGAPLISEHFISLSSCVIVDYII